MRADPPPDLHPARRLLRLWRGNPRADVDAEMQFHLESAIEEYVASGLSREQARAMAHQRFGDTAAIARTLHTLSMKRERSMNRQEWLHSAAQDARFALRQLFRNPGFSAVAVLTLALGIGATSAIFSVVNTVLLRPLPYANADRLLQLRERNGMKDNYGMVVSYGNYATWKEQARLFEALGAYTGDSPRTLTGVGDPAALRVTRASASYWQALAIPPVVGRYFTETEDVVGGEPVVVISQSLWQSRFAADSSIVGRSITLNGIAHRVLGVAPAAYALTPQAAGSPGIWLPLALTASQKATHEDHELNVVAIPREHVPAEAALRELDRIEAELARQYPNSYFDGTVIATPLRDAVVGNVRPVLLVLFGAVGLVLLIACANVTNLLLARAISRQKEMAIRSALGGGQRRIMRQLLIESIVLATAGAAVGLLVAIGSMRLLVRNAPANVPRLQNVSLDGSMVLFTVLLAVVTGIAFGLLPALRASRPDLQGTLREGSRDDTGARRQGLRSSLVVAQVAVALVLLTGAALLLRSGLRLQSVPPGFETRNILTATISLPAARYGTDEAVADAFDRVGRAMASEPGVGSAALISRIPIGASGVDCPVQPEGTPGANGQRANANQRLVTPALFTTLGIPLLAGRGFLVSDRRDAPLVVVVNRTLARRLYDGVDVVGKRLSSCTGSGAPVWRTIVGVIADVRSNGLASAPPGELYYPLAQVSDQNTMSLVVRGSVPVASLIPRVRSTLATIDPLLPLMGVSTMEETVARSLAVPRFTTLLLTLLGGLGLVLAAIGIYGVIAYFVVQRTREIGVRIALGARPLRVVALVVSQGLMLVVVGTAVGLVLSWYSAGALQQMLFQVEPHDPLVFGAVAATLVIVAAAACAVPAWRAARVDPLVAIRS